MLLKSFCTVTRNVEGCFSQWLYSLIIKDCGLKGATSHSGRRTYITKLANAGINVRLLAELAGHKHISTTQRYIDVNDT
ncbi:tyrosine-type recombinase/integrase, partial [Planktomarina temperata]|nr:tyrosine-type recombinase/integrase [Planktomarina temperata]